MFVCEFIVSWSTYRLLNFRVDSYAVIFWKLSACLYSKAVVIICWFIYYRFTITFKKCFFWIRCRQASNLETKDRTISVACSFWQYGWEVSFQVLRSRIQCDFQLFDSKLSFSSRLTFWRQYDEINFSRMLHALIKWFILVSSWNMQVGPFTACWYTGCTWINISELCGIILHCSTLWLGGTGLSIRFNNPSNIFYLIAFTLSSVEGSA